MSNNTDFVIPLHRYHCLVKTVVESIHIFYSPRNIFIISPKKDCEIIQEKKKTWIARVTVIPEETFFIKNYEANYNDIYDFFNKNTDSDSRSFGWWYQQLIKLGAFMQIPNLSDPYIVWDSDLIPLIKWNIYPNAENPYFSFAILQEKARCEWNTIQYTNSLYELTGLNICKPDIGTFVSHHFIFYHDILQELLENIENKHNLSWIEAIMKLSHNYYRFSEYHTVAAFMTINYKSLLRFHNYNSYGKYGIRIRESQSFMKEVYNFLKTEEISYIDFIKFAKHKYSNLPSYLQIEHI